MTAADIVLEKLRRADIRPAALADALKVSPSMASLILAGKRGVSTWHLDAVADLLGTSVPDLMRPVPPQKNPKESDLPGHGDPVSSAAIRPNPKEAAVVVTASPLAAVYQSADRADLLALLAETALAFRDLAADAAAWHARANAQYRRLSDAGGAELYARVGGQTPDPRQHQATGDPSDRSSRGRAARAPRPRKAG